MHTDGLQLAEAIAALERQGFTGQNTLHPRGEVGCGACGHVLSAELFEVVLHARIEGVSDPADETVVAGVRCPSCGARATLVLACGPRAGRLEAEVLAGLDFRQAQDRQRQGVPLRTS